MMFDSEQDPYRALRAISSERTSPIVVWVGSGLSQPAGLPSWGRLREIIDAAVTRKSDTLHSRDAAKITSLLAESRKIKNPWRAFQLLEEALGPASFRDTIREALGGAADAERPVAYDLLWKLRPSGVLSLNLDRLVTRSFYVAQPNRPLNEFTGGQAGQFTHLLKSPQSFVVNLHGVSEDASSWVLTAPQLRDLFASDGYRNFVRTCFSARTVVFVGITADDSAAGGHLEALSAANIDTGPHFWITHRTDLATDTWAEAAGIRVIRYTPSTTEHPELTHILRDLGTYTPKEDPDAPPLALTSAGTTTASPLPDPKFLARRDPDEIRLILNAHAAEILKDHNSEAYRQYADFCKLYDQAIYAAWYVTTEENNNQLLGYKLSEEIGEGAFARVFKARGLSRRLLNLAERGGSGAQHTALATVVKIAEGGREGIPT